jgi:hypothetical protein
MTDYFEVITDANTGQQTIRPYTAEEIAAAVESTSNSVRSIRNSLLAESDWTQVADATADKAAWATYRQELRDITAQSGFPHSVVWPTKPA